jgi:hypothetical protein
MFLKYLRKLPECKVAKYIKLSAVTNTETPETILYNYDRCLHNYWYTISSDEFKTVFYTENNSINFYSSPMNHRVLLDIYYDHISKKCNIFVLDKLSLSVKMLEIYGYDITYEDGEYLVSVAADEYGDPIYEEVGYYGKDYKYKISNLVKATNGNLYCTCEINERDLLVINLNTREVIAAFPTSDIQYKLVLANSFLIIIEEPFYEHGRGNTEIIAYVIDLLNERIKDTIIYDLDNHLSQLRSISYGHKVKKFRLGRTNTSRPDKGIDYILRKIEDKVVYVDSFYYSVNIRSYDGESDYEIHDSLKMHFKFNSDENEIDIIITTGENSCFVLDTEKFEIKPNFVLMNKKIKVEDRIDLSKTQLYYKPGLSKLLDFPYFDRKRFSTVYNEEFISKKAEEITIKVLQRYYANRCSAKTDTFTYRYYLDEKRHYLYVFIKFRCKGDNDDHRETYLVLYKCNLRKNDEGCSLLLDLGPYKYITMKRIIVPLLLIVYAQTKGNKKHFLNYLYSEAHSFEYDYFYVYKNEIMFVFTSHVYVSDIVYNRVVKFTHMRDVYAYLDDNSFKNLESNGKVVLCTMQVGEKMKEVIKVPIVVSEMDLVKRFQPVNLWAERTFKP